MFIYYLVHTNYLHAHHLCFLQGPTRLHFLVSFPELILNSCETFSDLCPSEQAGTPRVEMTLCLQLLLGTDLCPRGLWESWILSSYTVMPPSTEEPSVQHLEVSSAFPTPRNPCYHPVHLPLALASIGTTIFTRQPRQGSCRIILSHPVMRHQKLLALKGKGSRAGSICQDHNSVFQCLTKGGTIIHIQLLLRSSNKIHGQSLHTSQ